MGKEFSIYVHIPFCISKCYYCDFNSYASVDEEKIQKYVEVLINEIKNSTYFCNEICKGIYFGGGTPSYIDSVYIRKIINSIREKYIVDENAEVTIEVNPCSANKEKLKEYIDCGFNRLSIGLQTTDNVKLKCIGRKHTYEKFLEVYNLAREIGFKNINVDLMLALPNEKIEDVKKDVENIIGLNPEHISTYSLIVYEDTPMYEIIKESVMPTEKEERQMYHIVKEMLEKSGYMQYEISNYSKENMYSRHNMMCWKQKEYIGFGIGACSFIDNKRLQNSIDLDEYINNNNPVILEDMTNEELMNEYMMLGFRLIDGINIKDFETKYEIDIFEKYGEILSKLDKEGLIKIFEDKIIPTEKGLDLNNQLCIEFI